VHFLQAIGIGLMLGLGGLAISGDKAATRTAPAWPDTMLARVKALALLETLNASLLASHSATTTLDKWCADHKLASDPTIRARLVSGMEKPVTPEQRQRLRIGQAELVKYRRVELACGDHVLSEADNWYVPSRLSTEMNAILETTDTPFGRAVLDLKPIRQTFAVEIFWKPLADGWELGPPPADRPGAALTIPWRLFEHRALVYSADLQPFSEVNETYTSEILAFGPP
jgi:chorismate-pyruvate lyase